VAGGLSGRSTNRPSAAEEAIAAIKAYTAACATSDGLLTAKDRKPGIIMQQV
jgi:hypothetical protein